MTRRVLLKFSGELLGEGEARFGYDRKALCDIAERLLAFRDSGVELGVVLGGGNLFRGIAGGEALGIERSAADQAGMLATVMNGLLLGQAIRHLGGEVMLLSSFECPGFADLFRLDLAERGLSDGIVLFVGGTGHPYFTTDTAAALRACEVGADLLLKLTSVDGVYDKDPHQHDDARLFERISYEDYLSRKLGVMDLTAVTLCMEGGVPIRVNRVGEESFEEAAFGQSGSLIAEG